MKLIVNLNEEISSWWILFFVWVAVPFSSFSPFPSSSTGVSVSVWGLDMNICICIGQVLVDPQGTGIPGSSQQGLLGISNSLGVWCLHMGSLWMAFPSVCIPFYVSVFPLHRNISGLKTLSSMVGSILKLGPCLSTGDSLYRFSLPFVRYFG